MGKVKGKKIKGKNKKPGKIKMNKTIKGNIRRERPKKIDGLDFFKFPKIDLHCHLDGSLRAETVLELLKKDGIEHSDKIKEDLVAPKNCGSLDEYLEKFDLPLKVMQTIENLERVSYELFEDAAKENVKYLEVRFAPQQHKRENLTTSEIITAVLKGMKRAEEQYEIKGNYILSCMRHMSSESATKIIEEGKKFIGRGVVGVDLCGSEEKGFCNKFIEPMKKAREYGYHITIHAGETGYGENVADAIVLLGAERIGHGVFIEKDTLAYELVKEKRIPLEICPTSNVQTKAVEGYKGHPLYSFYKDGINITINTDNRTVSDVNMTSEYKQTSEIFSLILEDYKEIYMNSVEAAFIGRSEKEKLKEYI